MTGLHDGLRLQQQQAIMPPRAAPKHPTALSKQSQPRADPILQSLGLLSRVKTGREQSPVPSGMVCAGISLQTKQWQEWLRLWQEMGAGAEWAGTYPPALHCREVLLPSIPRALSLPPGIPSEKVKLFYPACPSSAPGKGGEVCSRPGGWW